MWLLVLPILLTLSGELLNTAIEKTIDELGQGKICPHFKFAKEARSAAEFLCCNYDCF
ncbi:diacylglycerol kinase [Candidatus Paracaedibacter symbiosus]|uniref:diacylglycerol kinase n=1 Tax=Candidatus Paracaedibacter symbiosus TaxID=244582 RepID=UPI000A05B3A8